MKRTARGLTLIELLIVIAIMAAAAGMIVSMTNRLDLGARQTETARRLGEIRSAILGPDAVTPTGELMSGGYLQDVGWLPDKPGDLLRRPDAVAPSAYSSRWKTWAGWRGPYLSAPPLRRDDSFATLYDDYGNDFYGWFVDTTSTPSWLVPRLSGHLDVRSAGADNTRDAAGGLTGVYERDYPDASQPLIPQADWLADLTGLQVEITNWGSLDFSVNNARFRMVVPRWDHWSGVTGEVDSALDCPANLSTDDFAGTEQSVTVPAARQNAEGKVISPGVRTFRVRNDTRLLYVPTGSRMLFLVDANGKRVNAVTGQPLGDTDSSNRPVCAELVVSRRVSPRTVRVIVGD